MLKSIFLDCGEVLFDNAKAGPQWDQYVGQFYAERFGGDPDGWARANRVAFDSYFERYKAEVWGHPELDYRAFQKREWRLLIERMCEIMNVSPPSKDEIITTVTEAHTWINGKISAEIPGAGDAVRRLDRLGYRLYTCSGNNSVTLRARLGKNGIADYFLRLYGPDLINRPKEGPLFYEKIFKDSGELAAESLVVDDKAMILEWAAETGATCVQISDETSMSAKFPIIPSLSSLPGYLGHIS